MAKTTREDRPQSQTRRESIKPWFSVLKRSWHDALAIDRSQITALPAIRSAIAFLLPLAIGVTTGHVVEGVSIAGGAASLGAVGMTYTYRARARTLLLACVGIAVSAFVGSITSRISWLAILVAGLWGFGAGLLVAVSPTATVVGIQSVVALIILTHFELDPLHAFLQAALMFAGALLQTLLAIIPFPRQDTAPERSALAKAYQKLAEYVENDSKEDSAWQAGNALLKASSVLSDSNQSRPEGHIFARLLEEAEQIRLSLIVLRRARRQLESSPGHYKELLLKVEKVRQATIAELRALANELQSHRSLKRSQPYQELRHAMAEVRRQSATYADDETVRRLVTYCDALLAQISAANVLLQARTQQHIHLSAHFHLPRYTGRHVRDAMATLRANLTLHSTTFRHAIRMGIALAVATVLYRVIPLPIQRGYWIPLTVLLVLRADFSSTFTRGIARFLGTILGAVLTTLLIATVAPTKEWLVVLDTLVAFLAFSLLFANYALFSAFITIEVILLLAFVTPQPIEVVAYRAIDTTLGGLLAWLVYILWPTWERTPDNIAHRLESLHAYFDATIAAYIDPTAYDDKLIQERRQEARLERSNMEASVDRLRKEPRRTNTELVQGLLEGINSFARATLALDAHLQDEASRQAHPELTSFTSKVDESLDLLTTSIREGQEPGPLPDLEGPLRAIEQRGKVDASRRTDTYSSLSVVIAEARRIVRSINTLNNLLTTKHSDAPMYELG